MFRRKKNKDGKKKKLVEVSKIIEEEKPEKVEVIRTKAELAFQKMQEKMVRCTYIIFTVINNLILGILSANIL